MSATASRHGYIASTSKASSCATKKSGAQTTMYSIGNLDTAQNSPERPTQAHERRCTSGEGVKPKIYMSHDTVGSAYEQKSMNTAAGRPPTDLLGDSEHSPVMLALCGAATFLQMASKSLQHQIITQSTCGRQAMAQCRERSPSIVVWCAAADFLRVVSWLAPCSTKQRQDT